MTGDEMDLMNRYTPPSKYDLAPFGTIVKVIGDGEETELYIQLSKDEMNANWKKVRHLLERTFSEYIDNKDFINACLDIYQDNDQKGASKKIIGAILAE
jgi:hypothetical protein